MKRRVDKNTKKFIPPGKSAEGINVSENWQGRIAILNTEKSQIAKKAGYSEVGEYAIKVR